MELKRLGLARKPMFTVPNHMLGQFSTELLTLYPGANILVAGKEDFESQNRKKLFSRIATGNWDAVIVTHSGFERIPLSYDTQKRFFDEQLHELEMIRREHADSSNRRLVKELEKAKKRLEAKLQSLAADHKKDNTLTFEELGVDRIFVDEAHYFKNLFYITKMTRIAGLPQTASERAFDMYLKVRHVQSMNGGGGVVFATGTPIANSMAEMFTMQRYFATGRFEEAQPPSLRFVGRDFRRAGDGYGAFTGRRGLPFEHALRPLHQCAGVDADFPSIRRRANRRDTQPATAETRRRKANRP